MADTQHSQTVLMDVLGHEAFQNFLLNGDDSTLSEIVSALYSVSKGTRQVALNLTRYINLATDTGVTPWHLLGAVKNLSHIRLSPLSLPGLSDVLQHPADITKLAFQHPTFSLDVESPTVDFSSMSQYPKLLSLTFIPPTDHLPVMLYNQESVQQLLQTICTHNTNLRELGLNQLYATELPSEIGNLGNLLTMELADNFIETLPESIGQLTNLKTLCLGGTDVHALPESIGQLTNLLTLDLSSTAVVDLPESITGLVSITNLRLQYTSPLSIPAIIGQLSSLLHLDLSSRVTYTALPGMEQEDFIPDAIGLLSNLVTLDASFSEFTSISNAIGQLSSLQTLDLRNNRLDNLPHTVGLLSNLKTLLLRHNRLTSVHDSIGQLINLRILDLNHNQITQMPDTIGNLINLEVLDVGYNQLRYFPDLGGKSNLHTIRLNSNHLENSVDDTMSAFRLLGSLRKLDLSDNQLRVNPRTLMDDYQLIPSLLSLSNLEELNLANNPLDRLPYSFTQLHHLTKLSVSTNQVKIMPRCFKSIMYVVES